MADPQYTFPCSVNSVPFWQSGSVRRPVDAAWNLGQQRYIDSLNAGQTKIPYNCKVLFSDTLTFQFKTQQNSVLDVVWIDHQSYSYTNQAKFHVCSSKIGSDGYPVPGSILNSFESELNPTYGTINAGSKFWGIQNPAFDTFTNPITGYTQQLVTFMWSFSFGDQLSQAGGDSGIYFLMFENYDITGAIIDTWYSEPILVFGTDARYTPKIDRTLLFQGQNYTDKSDILINAVIPVTSPPNVNFWFNNPNLYPTFSVRVESSILEYEPEGVYLGFRQDQYLQENTFSSSWETFTLQVGNGFGSTIGIPISFLRIVSRYIEFDILSINNVLYIYDLGEGSSGVSNAWKVKKNRVNGLSSMSTKIRYMFPSQGILYVNPLSPTSMIFTEEFSDVFS